MINFTYREIQDEETGLWIILSPILRYDIPTSIREEARSIFQGIYSWNASCKIGYAFNSRKGNSKAGITNGEFISKFDLSYLVRTYSFFFTPQDGFLSPKWSEYKHIDSFLSKKVATQFGISNKD